MFGHHDRPIRQQTRGLAEQVEGRFEEFRLVVRRIHDHGSRRACGQGIGRAQPGENLALDDLTRRSQMRALEVLDDARDRRRMLLHENRPRGAPRQAFDASGATAGEQVNDGPSAERRLEDGEQRLLDTIG